MRGKVTREPLPFRMATCVEHLRPGVSLTRPGAAASCPFFDDDRLLMHDHHA